MKGLNVNPLLISVLTGKDVEEIPKFPALSELPGKHVQFVAKNIDKIDNPFESNIQPLICGNCEKKAKYDLGLLTINIHKYDKNNKETSKYIQSTGYFRCKNCNSAGNWELTNEFMMMAITALITRNSPIANNRFMIGENKLYDGSSHQYASDAEEHLLQKIILSGEDAYIWNRLGNLYFKGNRADLAVSVYEHSLSIDPLQTESLFSLGTILSEAGASQEAAGYFHKMLLSASQYKQLDAAMLRDLLTEALHALLDMNMQTNGEISLIPPKGLFEELNIAPPETDGKSLVIMDLEISPDEFESFYPLAEMYMGKRSKELSRKKIANLPKKQKKKKKKKKQR